MYVYTKIVALYIQKFKENTTNLLTADVTN